MKRFMFLLGLVLLLNFPGREQTDLEYVSSIVGIDLPQPIQESYTDLHGGFHGDGEAFGVYQFDAEAHEEILKTIQSSTHWYEYPLSDDLQTRLYLDCDSMPTLEDGYWFVYDQQSEGETAYSDAMLNDPSRYSFNYKASLYDSETCTLYFFELDT